MEQQATTESSQGLSLEGLKRLAKRPSLWIIIAAFIILTIFHYGSQIEQPGFLSELTDKLGLERHAFERIAFMVPIIYSGLLYGRKASFAVALVALICMLPRAVVFSPYPADAVLETCMVLFLGTTIAISFDALRKERERKTDLEWADKALQYQLQVVKENERQLAALNQASDVLSQSLEMAEILNRVTEIAVDVMRVEAAMVYLVEEESGELSLAAYRGISGHLAKGMERIKIGEDINGRVAERGEPLWVENSSESPDIAGSVFENTKIRSLLSVPLKFEGKVVGTLSALMYDYRWFSEYDVELLTAIGGRVGVVLENARLYEHQRGVAEQLRVSEERYRELFESAHDAIWLHDVDGNIVAANRSLLTLTGYSMEELLKKRAGDMVAECNQDAATGAEGPVSRMKAMGRISEVMLTKKDSSEVAVQLSTNPLYKDNQIVAFQHIARDITEEKQMRDNLSFYLGEVTKAQEEERNRIARELHDDTIQALVVLSRQLDDIASNNEGFSENVMVDLENLRQQANNIIQGLRRLSQDLRPPILDRLGLWPALEWLASDVSQYSGIEVRPHLLGAERRLPKESELMLFRIAQEALRNMWRHSKATGADLLLEFDVGRIRITIKDNGIGFDLPSSVSELTRSGKLGLAGMRERALLLGGDMKIESGLGKGTTITVEVPL